MAQIAFHPGEHLQEELNELSLSPEEFANRLEIPVHELTEVLECRKSMTADLALRLGHFFGISPQFWMNLQSGFDLEQASRLHGAEIEALPTLQAA